MTEIPSGGSAILWGVITFSILIVLHEGGHFLAARAFGVKVHEFMLGLPAPAIRWKSRRSGVTYGVTILPLGGYVRIAGMEPGREDELLGDALGLLSRRGRLDAGALASLLSIPAERATALLATLEDYGVAEQPRDSIEWVPLVVHEPGEDDVAMLDRVRAGVYRGQPTWKRVTILSMGVLVNIVSAILILTLALTFVGVPRPTTTVDLVSPGGPAATAGIKAGDAVLSFDGTPITRWDQLQALLRSAKPGVAVPVAVRRGAATLTFTVSPMARDGGGALFGVTAASVNVPMGIGESLRESLLTVGAVFAAIGQFFNPATFQTAVKGASSVVGISYVVASAAQEGPLTYAWIVSLLSLSLGIMNILPIPPLDGGKIAIELAEWIFRVRMPPKLSIAFSATGAVLLFSLVFYLMYADVMRYIIRG